MWELVKHLTRLLPQVPNFGGGAAGQMIGLQMRGWQWPDA